MLLKILGIFDILAAIWIILLHHGIGSLRIGFILGLYLILKGYVFRDDWASYLDILTGVYLIFSLFATHWLLSYVFALYLGQKALFSLFA